MKRSIATLVAATVGAVICFGSLTASAQEDNQRRQGRGNFDPEQMRQRMMERYREQLDVKEDAEWKLISTRIEKVTEARRQVGGGMGAMLGRGPGGGGGGGGGGGQGGGAGGGQGGRRGFGADPLPEAEALQKAVEAKASNDELKAKLAKLRDARKEKEEQLEKAQEELRKVLSVKQEAAAVLAGLIK